MGHFVKKVTKSITGALGGLGHELEKAGANIKASGKGALILGRQAGQQSLKNPFQGLRTAVKGTVARADADNRALLGNQVGGYVIPVAVDVVSFVNPVVGSALGAGVNYAHGESPRQILGSAAAQYAGGKVGSGVAGATGSTVAGKGVGGFVGGTGSGLAQGKNLGEAAKQGAAQGLTQGTLEALNTPSTSPVTRELEKIGFSQGFNRLLGVSDTAQQSPYASLNSGFSAINPNTSDPNSAGGANISGAPIDISGSDTNQPRANVWNKASLRVKDALGA